MRDCEAAREQLAQLGYVAASLARPVRSGFIGRLFRGRWRDLRGLRLTSELHWPSRQPVDTRSIFSAQRRLSQLGHLLQELPEH
jgi:hypothetical protein